MAELYSSKHHFESPPVYETALTIQFKELHKFRTIHFGEFYGLICEQFPHAEDKPRAEPIYERFPRQFTPSQIRFLPKKSGPERVWYRDELDGALLLQLQADRISLNWRRSSEEKHYPSFQENGPKFIDAYRKLENFAAERELGDLEPNLCEVVYVNHVVPVEGESATECFARIFIGLEWSHNDDFLPQPEIATFNRVYEIGEKKGRLYAEAGIAKQPDLGEFVHLKVTARVLINPEDNFVDALQRAHDWVVDGFVSLTTLDAQTKRWRKRET